MERRPEIKVNQITCDMCGAVLAAHGKRSTVTISSVPAYRSSDKSIFDLCPACAARMKIRLSQGPKSEAYFGM